MFYYEHGNQSTQKHGILRLENLLNKHQVSTQTRREKQEGEPLFSPFPTISTGNHVQKSWHHPWPKPVDLGEKSTKVVQYPIRSWTKYMSTFVYKDYQGDKWEAIICSDPKQNKIEKLTSWRAHNSKYLEMITELSLQSTVYSKYHRNTSRVSLALQIYKITK